ncbi:uncharacterized protein AMSG_07370 [Thecamonas trahens ATCC 50062]|uniref:Uncharacterized protein n=1 Tax=Thecamonas trahens ATCC 50062 TaxID=461836 RepID=A0A0L0DGN8_THETB|nr:hypothetical protein AMSG_07370 [Thecamonas trahens ATCC 50062]KNC51355.1 hypothetical protein AMSG_07370 [Thecamonas trahens ATCC 50062]|eukprot:XP_013756275.1 hypothetical protein AMSG_07370 [Thecamonas trahens ATCC 50062]
MASGSVSDDIRQKFQVTTNIAVGLAREPMAAMPPNATMYSPSEKVIKEAAAQRERATEDILAADAVDFVASAQAGVLRPFESTGSFQTGLPWRDEDDPY